MDVAAIFTLSFAPGVFWLWYFYRKDKVEPEPQRLVAKIFFLGMVAGIPALLAEAPFRGFVLAVIAAPVIEEVAKFLVVRGYVYSDRAFSEPVDGIVYAAAAALGFASLENAGYLLRAYWRPETVPFAGSVFSATLSVFVVRGCLSVPGHVLFSAFWGQALGRAKFLAPQLGTKLVIKGLCLAALCHGLFNLSLRNFPIASLGGLVMVVFLWRLLLNRIAADLAALPFQAGGRVSAAIESDDSGK